MMPCLFKNQNTVLKLIIVLFVFIYLVANPVMIIVSASTPNLEVSIEDSGEQEVVLIDYPIVFSDINYETYYDIASCNLFVLMLNEHINYIREELSTNTYTIAATDAMVQELIRLESIVSKVNLDITKIASRRAEYPYAAKTWEFLMQKGYSEVVASAIIGNMMVETGGGSLHLDPNLYDYATGQYYGLCQWSLYYRPEIADMSFDDQLEYLVLDIEQEFDTFGFLYAEDFTYEDFINMKDPAEAAYAFAKVYERCASWSLKLRRPAAVEAYSYFKL